MVDKELSPALLLTLYKLAELGAYPTEVLITTTRLADRLNVSQQTASRHLIELQTLGLINRIRAARGESIRITEKGSEELNRMYLHLKMIFETRPRDMVFEGTLFSGIGEGAWYVSRPGYRKQFLKKLGFDAFPGTLNVKLGREFEEKRKLLESFPHIQIDGFRNGERSFGPVRCYRAEINGTEEGALISAVRTHYPEDVIELIAPNNLRTKLRLKDGDIVKARVVTSTPKETSA